MKPFRIALVLTALVLVLEPVSVPAETEAGHARFTPWSGYWWPNKKGGLSKPLTKYSRYVGNTQALNWQAQGTPGRDRGRVGRKLPRLVGGGGDGDGAQPTAPRPRNPGRNPAFDHRRPERPAGRRSHQGYHQQLRHPLRDQRPDQAGVHRSDSRPAVALPEVVHQTAGPSPGHGPGTRQTGVELPGLRLPHPVQSDRRQRLQGSHHHLVCRGQCPSRLRGHQDRHAHLSLHFQDAGRFCRHGLRPLDRAQHPQPSRFRLVSLRGQIGKSQYRLWQDPPDARPEFTPSGYRRRGDSPARPHDRPQHAAPAPVRGEQPRRTPGGGSDRPPGARHGHPDSG